MSIRAIWITRDDEGDADIWDFDSKPYLNYGCWESNEPYVEGQSFAAGASDYLLQSLGIDPTHIGPGQRYYAVIAVAGMADYKVFGDAEAANA